MSATAAATSAVKNIYAKHLPLAEKARVFLTASTDPFHAVKNSVAALEAAGFVRVPNASLSNTDNSKNVVIQPGGKYYYTVHHSTLVAFAVGGQFRTGQGGFLVIGGHTDSPNLRVKPRSQKPVKNGCVQLGVECYGGGLWHTWFDRDLSISGKVLVRSKDQENTKIEHCLVQLKDPIARVSTLCIHLQSASEREGFSVNKEDHTSPIVASRLPNKELTDGAEKQINATPASGSQQDAWQNSQEPALMQRLAEALNVETSQIADFDLSLYDTQGAVIGGMQQEFLFSGRLDNLATVFCAVQAVTEFSTPENLEQSADVHMICCFDHEEVGSVSTHGAGSPVLLQAVQRVSAALNKGVETSDLYADTMSKSFCLSIDQAHAVHPNYASKHEAQHAPVLNGGVVIKTNSNQRYTTNSLTGFVVRELARKTGIPIQEFCVRNDCPCGSTIGPAIAALTGIRTVDAGMPQLSMHSCREVMGTADLTHGLTLFKGFFQHFREIDNNLSCSES